MIQKMTETGQLEITSSTFIWKIENFSEKCSKFGEFITSPFFKSSDCKNKIYPKWNLELYPFGINEKSKDHLSIYLAFKSESAVEKYECSYEISINDGFQNDMSTKRKLSRTRNFTNKSQWGWAKFIERNELFKKKDTLLKQDTLIISCSISDVPLTTVGEVSISLIDGYETIFLTGDFSDITIVIDDKKIKAHKAVLSARSNVFSAMLKNDMTETNTNLITITDVEYIVMKQFLLFLYSGKVYDIEDSAKYLLPVANKYDVDDLKDLCETTLLNKLTSDNACELLSIADLYNCFKLKSKAIDLMISNMKKIYKTKDFGNLSSSNHALFTEIFETLVEKKL